MELIAKLASNDTPNIRSFPRASEYISIKFADQCLHIIIIKERLNGLKISTKKRKRNTIQISITFTTFKLPMMLITEKKTCYGTTNCF